MSEEQVHWLVDGNCALCGANSDFKPHKKGEAFEGVFHRFTDCQPELVTCEECLANTGALASKVEVSALELAQAAKNHADLVHALTFLIKHPRE